MAYLSEPVSDDGLRRFAESCALSPSILARRLRLDDSTIEQIRFGHQNDRYEQIYLMLMRWKQESPKATWKDLQEATDSGIKRVLSDLYPKDDSKEENGYENESSNAGMENENNSLITGVDDRVQINEGTHSIVYKQAEEESSGPPPCKIAREASPVPSAPPFELVYPVQEVSRGDDCSDVDETDCGSTQRTRTCANTSTNNCPNIVKDKDCEQELTC